jgi:hypothetical protein
MDERIRAAEHLHTIRTLMERSTIYRAISAPTALIGGATALLLSAFIQWREYRWAARSSGVVGHISALAFASLWLAALVFVLLVNTFFIYREAQRDHRPLISPPMKLALHAILPCLCLPAAVTVRFFADGYGVDHEFILVCVWIGFYGLALIATQHFAPRSLVILGWAFLLTALLMTIGSPQLEPYSDSPVANIAMGAAFGLYHLIYAACVWRSAQPFPE